MDQESGLITTHVVALMALRQLFAGVRPEDAALLIRRMRIWEYEEGGAVFEEGAIADEVFCVVEGRVRLFRGGVHVMDLERGELFGEAALLDATPHEVTARAATRAKVLAMERAAFFELMEISSEFLRSVVVALSDRLRQALAAWDKGREG